MLWSELSAFKSLPAGAGRPPERAVGRLYHRSERLSFASFGGVAETLLFVAPGPSCESRRDSPRVLCEGPALLTFLVGRTEERRAGRLDVPNDRVVPIRKPQTRTQKKRGAWQTHTRLPTNKSIFRVPQGSRPYRHSMSIPYYKSSSADSVKPAQLTLSHHRTERLSFAAALFLSEERSPAL